MKKTNIIYWILTGLAAALMLFSSISSLVSPPQAEALIVAHLGYPLYFLVFISVAKFLGAVAILIPGFPRIKEWAYAGLMYDLIAAMYSFHSIGDPASAWLPILLPITLVFGSYFFYHKKLKEILAANTK